MQMLKVIMSGLWNNDGLLFNLCLSLYFLHGPKVLQGKACGLEKFRYSPALYNQT